MSKRKRERTDGFTAALHWVTFATLMASFLTGLRISADRPESTWARAFEGILPQGDVMSWHLWAGFTLALVSIAYIVFLIVSGVRSRIALNRARVTSVVTGSPRQRLRVVNVLIYWLGFTLLLLASATGVVHYLMPPFVRHETLLAVHYYTAWLLLAYIALHVGAQIAHGGLMRVLKILSPRPAYGSAALVALAAAGYGGAALLVLERTLLPELHVRYVARAPALDGRPQEAVWEHAPGVRIHTVRGANHDDGEVTVNINAVHDGEYLYTLFRWRDDTRSQKHLPLVKTPGGWKVQQTEYGRQDEDFYYEDKFAVMWANTARNVAAGTVQLGRKPLDDKPGPTGGRGLHYTNNGQIVDVWHWKSVRTGSVAMGQIDDNYFGPPMPLNPNKKRYTGGYTQDPNTGGGYTMNWEQFNDDIIRPKRLPKDPSVLTRMGPVNLNPGAGDMGEFWLKLEETVPYTATGDIYPVGTVMPSVLLKGNHRGDRGDVHAASTWRDGWWRMEVKRRLDTGSKYDVAFEHGEPLYMWVAAFDHAQTRHSYHIRPVRVVVQ
ncbi:MAG: ethylbenzene dehydrogenase-related protein [Gammaproteobacteria bacterium]